jgi:hypothetical protein
MNFLEIIILIVVIVVSIIAIRISLSFDINRFLENRRKIKINQLKNVCPHLNIDLNGKKLIIESYFSSPAGTIQWVCSQCGLVVNSEEDVKRLQQPFLKNPNLYIEQKKKFDKLAKNLELY